MMGDWFWKRPEDLAPQPELPAPPKPRFDRQRFDQDCFEAESKIELLMDHGGMPDTGLPYDPRIVLIKGIFYAYAAGLESERRLDPWLRSLIRGLLDNPGAAVLGCEVAKAGYLAMGRPMRGAAFASLASVILRRYGLLRPRLSLPSGD